MFQLHRISRVCICKYICVVIARLNWHLRFLIDWMCDVWRMCGYANYSLANDSSVFTERAETSYEFHQIKIKWYTWVGAIIVCFHCVNLCDDNALWQSKHKYKLNCTDCFGFWFGIVLIAHKSTGFPDFTYSISQLL